MQCGREVQATEQSHPKNWIKKSVLYVKLILEQSFFDEYKGDEITIISRAFYLDIGILVVEFCLLY